jgi:REP element-mobilizing transposase RayT
MANTFTQIYMHIIFAVNKREAMIGEVWRDELYHYLAAICQHRNHFVYAINGTADHVHLLVGMHPSESVASLVKEMKGQSSRWINQKFYKGTFSWQGGYGAFSYSRSMVAAVKGYIDNQCEHHRKKTFEEELAEIFQKAGIEARPEYMMHGVE